MGIIKTNKFINKSKKKCPVQSKIFILNLKFIKIKLLNNAPQYLNSKKLAKFASIKLLKNMPKIKSNKN